MEVDVQEVRKLDAYLKRVFGNQKIRVVPRPKKDDSAEVYIGEEFIGVLFVDDEDDDRSFQFQMAILEEDLVDPGGVRRPGRGAAFAMPLRRAGPYQTPAFVTAPALQRTASQGLRVALRPGHGVISARAAAPSAC